MKRTSVRALFATLLIALSAASLTMVQASAQGPGQALVQVPFVSTVVGVSASTYNGTDSKACYSPIFKDAFGDGCPANQGTLSFPYGVALDSNNNLFIGEYTSALLRVAYQGGDALAAALVAAYPTLTFTPTPGYIYAIGGAKAITSKALYCNNVSGTVALNNIGDGCPGQYADIKPRITAVDRDGNVFFADAPTTANNVRVFYVQGSAAARLITAYNPTVTAPMPGYVYSISLKGDFVAIRDIAVDAQENLYVADNGAVSGNAGNQLKRLPNDGSGWVTYIAGGGAAATSADGDGGPYTAAVLSGPFALVIDANNNLYINDQANARIRIVYAGGITPPLYIEGANSTVVTNPQPGYIYTVAGGGTVRTTGSPASSLSLGALLTIGLDNNGNLLFHDSGSLLWRVSAATGTAVVIGGSGATTAGGYSAATAPVVPAAGVPCNGTSGGPVMLDADANGCPASEVLPYGPKGHIVSDTAGNLYNAESRFSTAGADGIVRKYTFAGQFGNDAVGNPLSASLAYTATTPGAVYTPTASYVLTGNNSTEFVDAGNNVCSLSGPATAPVQTCVYNVTFTPALPGARFGALNLTNSGTLLLSSYLGGTGIGPLLTLDPAAQSTIGSGLMPTGVAVDEGGSVFLADATVSGTVTGKLLRSAGGAAPVVLATGFNAPAQVAVDGAGNAYVADTGNNRIAQVTPAGVVSTYISGFNGLALSAPTGVAVDTAGTIYVADTGNNRVYSLTAAGGVVARMFTGLKAPHGLAVDAAGDVFVADTGNSRIVELTAAGVQKVITPSPALSAPVGVAVDSAGDLFVADANNLNVTEIAAGSTNAISLIGSQAALAGVAVDTTGNVFVAASASNGVLKLNRTQTSYTFPDTNVGETAAQTLTLNNTGNAGLTLGTQLSAGTDTTNFSIAPASASNGCSVGLVIASSSNCTVVATFKPQSKATVSDSVTFPSNALDSATMLLIGAGVQKVGSTTTVTYTVPTGGAPLAGTPLTVTATVSLNSNAGALTGTVTFSVDGGASTAPAAVSSTAPYTASASISVAAGPHTITAVYSGDINYNTSAGSVVLTVVSPASTTTTLSATPVTPLSNTQFTLSSTISSTLSQGVINGTVTFTVSGVSQNVAVTAVNGVATASANFTEPTGKYNATAVYSGNNYYSSSTASQTVQVVPSGTSSVKVSISPATATIPLGTPVVVTAALTTGNATATPTGTVVFTVDGGAAQTFAYASSVSATFTSIPAGTHTITVAYSGDNAYAPGSSSVTAIIVKATPVVTFTASPNVGANDTITFTSTVTGGFAVPTGTVTFSNASGTIGTATLAGGLANFTSKTNVLASYALKATYNGDINFQPVTVNLTPAADFEVNLALATATTAQYGVALYALQLNSFFGYAGAVTVSCTGLPAYANCRATPSVTTAVGDAVTPIQLQIYTCVDPTAISQDTTGSFGGHGKAVEAVFAFSLMLGLPFWRTRRKLIMPALGVLLLGVMLSISGCGSSTRQTSPNITPTGTYTVLVTVTDGTVTRTTPISLIILPGSGTRP